ncbi:hypothetical protein RND81_06G126400 [Saponaria officinalis]|uniref:Uncharacterized protein n=1 Tax=Saponaria officinalis TaxID=3572 RepID=A0AAW1KB18_SAPOF
MRPSNLIVALIFLQFVSIVLSQQNFTYYQCNDFYGTYKQKSSYQANLIKVLYMISLNTQIDYGFYNFSVGNDPNTVNAIALCRGDLTKTECSKCRYDATIKLPKLCPKEMEAIGWYPNCTLWYSTRPIFGINDKGIRFEIFNTVGEAPVPDNLDQVLVKLLASVNTRTSSGNTELKYAAEETSITSKGGNIYKIYALSQCNPDLSTKTCLTCLEYLTNLHFGCCGNETSAMFAGPSCGVRYEPYRFYNLIGRPLILPEISVTPSPAPAMSYAPLYTVSSKQPIDSSNDSENNVDISSIQSLQYDFGTVKAATDNFSEANELGRGGFGSVYKGKIPNGQEIAVKRLASNNSGQGEAEFKNEIALLAKLQHRNLVRLLGFCLEKKERILIYEFVPNASLDHFLFESTENEILEWSERRQIIGGITQGLVYLHEHSRLKIIHRDLKPANILLDSEMNPKIADFGLAKLFPSDETHEHASRIAGTFGYMAPEYTRYKQLSVKSDVYSFGILLLEIICGRRNSGYFEEEFVAGLVSLNLQIKNNKNTTETLISQKILENPQINPIPDVDDAQKMRSVHEIVGIPPIDMDALVSDAVPTDEVEIMADGTVDLIQFTAEDVKEELAFWKTAVYCFILGANPPWDVVEGFVYRVWAKHEIDEVAFLPNGVFLVRFKVEVGRDDVPQQGHFLFDNKPVIVKPWSEEVQLVKENVNMVPVWVRLLDLPLKFWGLCIPRIGGLLGEFIICDRATIEKTRLGFV